MKSTRQQWASFLAAIVLAVGLSGCATSFHAGKLPNIKRFPTAHSAKSISVDLVFTGKLNGEPWTGNNAHNSAYLKNKCVDHLNESGMFGYVASREKAATDLHLQVAVINEKKTSTGRQFLTAITLFIVPYKSTDTFRMLAVLKNPQTGQEQRILIEDTVSHYQQLLLAPLSLLKPQDRALDKCRDRLFDNLCLELHKTGMLD